MLAWGYLVVLGLCRNTKLPELVVDLLHECVNRRADSTKVVLLELLALGWLRAKQGAASKNQVGALLVVLLGNKEVLLLGANVNGDLLGSLAKESEQALGLGVESIKRAQKRGLLVECFAAIRDKGGRDAENLILNKGRA